MISMMPFRVSLISAALFFCFSGFAHLAQSASPEAELLAMHQADRRAHFARGVDALLATLPPTFIMARDGKIERFTQAEMRQRFREYFQGATFVAWDDLESPIVHISPDGNMGWMAVRLTIAIDRTGAAGKKTREN